LYQKNRRSQGRPRNMEEKSKDNEEKPKDEKPECVICGRISYTIDPMSQILFCDEMCQRVHYKRQTNISKRFQKMKI